MQGHLVIHLVIQKMHNKLRFNIAIMQNVFSYIKLMVKEDFLSCSAYLENIISVSSVLNCKYKGNNCNWRRLY